MLGIKYDFTRWVHSNFKEFAENTDLFSGHIDMMGNQYGGTQTIDDYDLTIDMAKHLCLMSKTEKGKNTEIIIGGREWKYEMLIIYCIDIILSICSTNSTTQDFKRK